MIRKTVVTRQAGMYSAFPTFTRWEDEVFVFYRQARANRSQAHGRQGRVRCWSIHADKLARLLRDLFIRQDTPPFWCARSADLVRWSEPLLLFGAAQAPMAFVRHGGIGLAFRDLSPAEGTALSILSPFAGREKIMLDVYPGSPYDGGYSDPGSLAGGQAVFYYCGNEAGEPQIKGAFVSDGDGVNPGA